MTSKYEIYKKSIGKKIFILLDSATNEQTSGILKEVSDNGYLIISTHHGEEVIDCSKILKFRGWSN